jgi:hypothetical protein
MEAFKTPLSLNYKKKKQNEEDERKQRSYKCYFPM